MSLPTTKQLGLNNLNDGDNTYTIFYDDLQEGHWFKELNPVFKNAHIIPISNSKNNEQISELLFYDRPDIILLHKNRAILVG